MELNKNSVYSSVLWKVGEGFCAKFVSFIVSIILARTLLPEDYGIITLLMVFISFADIFLLEGFSSALIQKKIADNIDFSTALYFNILLSIVFYMIVFFSAPFIADFYEMKLLSKVLRIMALRLPLGAFNSIQRAFVTRSFQFKKFFWSTLIGTIISAIIGIGMALEGYGVWALVVQMLSNTLMDTLFLWITVRWRPSICFSFVKLKELLEFGGGVLGYNLVMNFYDQLRSLVIGKVYTPGDLAYYSKGGDIPNIIVLNINSSMSDVFFSFMSRKQENKDEMCSYALQYIELCTFVLSPMLIGLCVVGGPLISLLYTSKWIGIVKYLRIFCVGMLLRPLSSVNIQVLKSIGKSKELLKMDLIVRFCGIAVLLSVVKAGVIYIAMSTILVSIIGILLYVKAVNKSIELSLNRELKMWIYGIYPSLLMGVVLMVTSYIIDIKSEWGNLVIQIVIGILSFIFISIITKHSSFKKIWSYLKSKIKRYA